MAHDFPGGCLRSRVRSASRQKLRIIVFGAHPDDAELKAGGSAAKWAKLGHEVKMVSVTNGDIGHWQEASRWRAAGWRR